MMLRNLDKLSTLPLFFILGLIVFSFYLPFKHSKFFISWEDRLFPLDVEDRHVLEVWQQYLVLVLRAILFIILVILVINVVAWIDTWFLR